MKDKKESLRKNHHKLIKDVNFLKTILLTGFLKSTLGTALISIGTALFVKELFTNLYLLGGVDAYIFALIGIIGGVLIYLLGDIYQKEKKEDELNLIQDRIIDIATKIIDQEEKQKNQRIDNQLKSIEYGLCNDIGAIQDQLDDGHKAQLSFCDPICNPPSNQRPSFINEEILSYVRDALIQKEEEVTIQAIITELDNLEKEKIITPEQKKSTYETLFKINIKDLEEGKFS